MLTKNDKKYLNQTFTTKDDLNTALNNHPTYDQTKRMIRDEFIAQKPEWVREITESVKHALGDKIDKMYEKLDTFIGEIKARREEDALHAKQHADMDDQLELINKKLGIPNA